MGGTAVSLGAGSDGQPGAVAPPRGRRGGMSSYGRGRDRRLAGHMRAWVLGAPPGGVGNGRSAGVVAPQTAGPIPHAVLAVEVAADTDAEAGAGATPGLLGELQGHRVKDDDVVLAHGAVVRLAEDLVEIDVPDGDEGGGGIGGRPGELRVVGGEEVVAQIGIGGL